METWASSFPFAAAKASMVMARVALTRTLSIRLGFRRTWVNGLRQSHAKSR